MDNLNKIMNDNYNYIVIIGIFAFFKTTFFYIYQFILYILPEINYIKRYGAQSNNWAVITGGSEGIGLGFAQELSLKGFNICIISRNINKL